MIPTPIERLRPRPVTPEASWSATTLSSIVQGQRVDTKRNETAQANGPSGRFDLGDRRWSVLGAVVAALLAAVFFVHNLWPTPAFAVTGHNDAVEVRVTRLEGADGLREALGKKGIKADITYLAAGQHCARGRYTKVPTPDDLIVAVNADGFLIIIPKGAVDTDDTLVVSAFVTKIPGGSQADVDAGVAHGAVAPCTVVAAR